MTDNRPVTFVVMFLFRAHANISHACCKLEALECLSSSVITLANQGNVFDFQHSNILRGILFPAPRDSSNWLSGDVAANLECHTKLDLALQYFSKLIREHPSWADTIENSAGSSTSSREYESDQHVELLESFRRKLYRGLEQYEQKFSLLPLSLISKVHIIACDTPIKLQ